MMDLGVGPVGLVWCVALDLERALRGASSALRLTLEY